MKKNRFTKRIRSTLIFIIIACTLLLTVIVSIKTRKKLPAEEIFVQHILNPIPESVTDIKVTQPKKINGYSYILMFNISKPDLDLIINSRPFVTVWNVKYNNKQLSWEWDKSLFGGFSKYGTTIQLYKRQRKPRWFNLEQWSEPEMYGFVKCNELVNFEFLEEDSPSFDKNDCHYEILIYNKNEDQVYFIIYHPIY